MDLLNMELWIIKDMFPKQSVKIEELYKLNEDFRSLCSDYILCKTNLKKFQQEYGEKQNAIQDYQNVLGELETELHDFIFNDK